jgi:hypothetical protein
MCGFSKDAQLQLQATVITRRTEKLPLQPNTSVRSSSEGQAMTFSSSLCLPSLCTRRPERWKRVEPEVRRYKGCLQDAYHCQ